MSVMKVSELSSVYGQAHLQTYCRWMFYRIPLSIWIGVFVIAGCSGGKSEMPEESTVRAVPVEGLVLKSQEIISKMASTGTIHPFQQVIVSSEVSGTIDKVNIKVGDRVQSESVLVTVERELKELAVQQAEAQVIKMRASHKQAIIDRGRLEKLVNTADISQNEFDIAMLQEETARGDLQMAEAAHKTALRQLNDTWIRSPINGFVAERHIEIGTAVVPGTYIAKIIDIKRVKVSIRVAEADIGRVHLEQQVTVSVDGIPDKEFKGVIYTIGPEAEISSRTFPVEVLLSNDPDISLKSGMVANVTVLAETIQDAILVPRDAVLGEGDTRWVYVVRDSTAQMREVETGRSIGSEIQIGKGLQSGETVVTVGQRQLADGTKVKVRVR